MIFVTAWACAVSFIMECVISIPVVYILGYYNANEYTENPVNDGAIYKAMDLCQRSLPKRGPLRYD
jgi:hypothetical protein